MYIIFYSYFHHFPASALPHFSVLELEKTLIHTHTHTGINAHEHPPNEQKNYVCSIIFWGASKRTKKTHRK